MRKKIYVLIIASTSIILSSCTRAMPAVSEKEENVSVEGITDTEGESVSDVNYVSDDDKFLKYLKEALETRWALDEDETYGMDANVSKKWYQVRADAESAIMREAGFDESQFDSDDMESIVEMYFSALDRQDEALTYYYSDKDMFNELWQQSYFTRAAVILSLVEEFNFSVDAKYDDILDEMVSAGNKVYEIDSEQENNSANDTNTTENNVIVRVGDCFEADGLRITVEDADLEYWTYNTYYDQVYNQGLKYVGVSFSVDNISDSDEIISAYDFECYADNALCEMASFKSGNTGTISKGRQTAFTVYWIVPYDAGSIELEYEYRDDFRREKTVIIELE